MSATQISLEVHCLGPSWVQTEKNRYRLYINNEMLVERDWIWPTHQYINENIWVDAIPGILNTIKLEPILQTIKTYNPILAPAKNELVISTESISIAKFAIKNVHVNSQIISDKDDEQLEVSFHI